MGQSQIAAPVQYAAAPVTYAAPATQVTYGAAPAQQIHNITPEQFQIIMQGGQIDLTTLGGGGSTAVAMPAVSAVASNSASLAPVASCLVAMPAVAATTGTSNVLASITHGQGTEVLAETAAAEAATTA